MTLYFGYTSSENFVRNTFEEFKIWVLNGENVIRKKNKR